MFSPFFSNSYSPKKSTGAKLFHVFLFLLKFLPLSISLQVLKSLILSFFSNSFFPSVFKGTQLFNNGFSFPAQTLSLPVTPQVFHSSMLSSFFLNSFFPSQSTGTKLCNAFSFLLKLFLSQSVYRCSIL